MDRYYHQNWRRATWKLKKNYKISYAKNKLPLGLQEVKTSTKVSLDGDHGFTHLSRSELAEYETVTDAFTAHALSLYTIGPYFTRNENLAGLARQEQGEQLMRAFLKSVVKV